MIFSPGWVTNIEVLWEWPDCVRFFSRLARNSRVVLYDKQGTGLSDRVATFPSLEARMDDIHALMRATGMDRVTLFGPTQGAALSALFAASFPQSVESLVTYGDFASTSAFRGDGRDSRWDLHLLDGWGTEGWAYDFAEDWGAGALRDDPTFIRWLARLLRFSSTPTAAVAFSDAWEQTDVRHVLPTIGVPTLLLYRANQGEREEVEHAASLIPLARVVELPADLWSPYLGRTGGDGRRDREVPRRVRHEEEAFDRVLATIVFTDIVGSTERAAQLGDRSWKELVERHHAVVRALLGRYRGAEVDTAGDGFFATFDGPARAVRFAQACVEAVRSLGIETAPGVHTGEVETIDGKVGGIAVSIGARVGALAGASQVVVSQTVKDLVAGSGLVFEDAGEHDLKGVPDRWRLYRVAD